MYLYVSPDLRRAGTFEDAALASTTERHHIRVTVPRLDPIAGSAAIVSAETSGAVLELSTGLPTAGQLDLLEHLLDANRRGWIYFPAEEAIECVDDERLESLRRHVAAVRWLRRVGGPAERMIATVHRGGAGLRWIYRGEFPVRRSDVAATLDRSIIGAQPVAPSRCAIGADQGRIAGVGVHLRTDFWNESVADESLADVISQLASITDKVVCLTPARDPLIAQRGVAQIVMDPPPALSAAQDAIVQAPAHFLPLAKIACQTLRPAYVYERTVSGQSAGAELSQLLRLPYVIEYPGSATVLRASLGGAAPAYPELYSRAEELAIRQATVVIVPSQSVKTELVARGVAAGRVLVAERVEDVGARLPIVLRELAADRKPDALVTGDAYKDQVQNQWNENPVGSHHARTSQPHTLDWFLEVERHRYGVYAPWMPDTMEFARHAGHDVLEIGGGLGTDLAQFALNGAAVTDLDLAAGHLERAEENFRLRGLTGRFIHHDAESLPFADGSFDLVYSNGVLHHTPNTAAVVAEIHRVLRPGGRAIVMLYAENSLHYWRQQVWDIGIREGALNELSMGEIMSRSVERSANDARPLVKVYTQRRAEALFKAFGSLEILQRQLLAEELPVLMKWTRRFAEPLLGWNLVVKATKRR